MTKDWCQRDSTTIGLAWGNVTQNIKQVIVKHD